MKKKITKKQLQRLVESKVDEAWYNNIDDFYHGVGKCATIGALGAGSLMGGAYCLDKGLENQEKYEQYLNQEATKMSYGSDHHYQQWCDERGLDPNSSTTQDYYDGWVEDQLQENKIRNMVRRAIVETYVRNELSRRLSESTLYTNNINTDDLRVNVSDYNEDGYCEWEATCDNGWYTFRGTYAGGDCELDDVISGHSGYGHQHVVDDDLRNWFYENLQNQIVAQIESC